MMEARLFPEGTVPEWTTPDWYALRETAPHLEQEGHRQRLELTADHVRDALMTYGGQVVDLGAGDGGLLQLVAASGRDDIGFDLQQSNVDASQARGVTVFLRDIIAEPVLPVPGDLVVATELLEHLLEPHALVRRIYYSPARVMIASSPYTETAEDHYGFHTWAWDQEAYREMFEKIGWKVIRQDTAWISQVITAVKP